MRQNILTGVGMLLMGSGKALTPKWIDIKEKQCGDNQYYDTLSY